MNPPRLDEEELRRRALRGVLHEVTAFGSAAPDSELALHPGLTAAVVPSAPDRSVFNSVYYEDPEQLAARADELAGTYAARGVRAWTVWVPDQDRGAAEMLAERGHCLDAAPRAMALDLADLGGEPAAPEGVELRPLDAAACAALNDRAYGYEEGAFAAAFSGGTVVRWHGAFEAGEPLACVGTIDAGEDCGISGVATPPEHRGRGLASWLLWQALAGARERGHRSASLRASKAGAPLYERLGFRDLGFVEMWELRR
jgi:GNAT superfamily N-acetyltransferase